MKLVLRAAHQKSMSQQDSLPILHFNNVIFSPKALVLFLFQQFYFWALASQSGSPIT